MKILTACCALLLLTACGTTIIKKEIVTVDKPVPFVPLPPNVPRCVLKVDQLTDADVKTPGKVGQAYKHDTLCLRQTISIYEQILQQYVNSAQDFTKINEEIGELYRTINDAENKAVDRLSNR